jgi:hypothetical protein
MLGLSRRRIANACLRCNLRRGVGGFLSAATASCPRDYQLSAILSDICQKNVRIQVTETVRFLVSKDVRTHVRYFFSECMSANESE